MLIDLADALLTKICSRKENTIIFYHDGTFLSCAVPRYRDTIQPSRIVGVYNDLVSLDILVSDLQYYLQNIPVETEND